MIIISLIYTYCLSMFSFFHETNILQKQHYDFARYIKIKRKLIKISWIKNVLFIIGIAIAHIKPLNIIYQVGLLVLIFFLSFIIYKSSLDDEVIKFKITNRIKRFLVIYTVFYGIYVTLCLIFKIKCLFIPLIYFVGFYFIFFISYFISLLLEKLNLKRYQMLAKRKLKKNKNLVVIAITGSFGKTSTKHYTKQLLETKYDVLATQKSYNTMVGILKTINEELKISHDILMLELGIDKKGGMNKYTKFLNYDIGVIVSIGKQHLSTFHSLDNIEKEKIKLLLSLKSNKLAIINLDDPLICNHLDEILCKKTTISATTKADIYATNIVTKSNTTFFDMYIYNKKYSIKTSILGAHHITNILIAVAIAKSFKIEDDIIVKKVKNLKSVEHRMELKKDYLWDIIDDSYNSNQKGFIEALSILAKSVNKRVLITPGIIELNNENEPINKSLAIKIKECVDLVLLVGSNANSIYSELLSCGFSEEDVIKCENFKDATYYLKNNYTDQKLTILVENDLPDIYLN